MNLKLRAADGHDFAAYLARPADPAVRRGAVVVVQEVFGVTSHIRRVADQFAGHGYLAIAPALFDRQQRGVELAYDQDGIQQGIALARRADLAGLVADLDASIETVAHAGPVGMVGYCWGGRVVYLAGSRTSIAAGVVYYGGGIPDVLEPAPRCPMLFHFGDRDAHIPLADVERIRQACPRGEYHVYAADHGFNCTDRASYDAAAAHLAFERTLDFFRRTLA